MKGIVNEGVEPGEITGTLGQAGNEDEEEDNPKVYECSFYETNLSFCDVNSDVNIPTLARLLCRQVKQFLWRHFELGAMVLLRSGQIGSISASLTRAQVLPSF